MLVVEFDCFSKFLAMVKGLDDEIILNKPQDKRVYTGTFHVFKSFVGPSLSELIYSFNFDYEVNGDLIREKTINLMGK